MILDEPTTGLDPNQIVEIRKVIKQISQQKTVIFSTHIMQEVQALCDRVIIINLGEIVADNLVNELQITQGESQILVEFESDVHHSHVFQEIEGVNGIETMDKHSILIRNSSPNDIRGAVFRKAVEHQMVIIGMKKEDKSLENVFQELTQKPSI